MATSFDDVDTEQELRGAIFSLSKDFANGDDNGPYTINPLSAVAADAEPRCQTVELPHVTRYEYY